MAAVPNWIWVQLSQRCCLFAKFLHRTPCDLFWQNSPWYCIFHYFWGLFGFCNTLESFTHGSRPHVFDHRLTLWPLLVLLYGLQSHLGHQHHILGFIAYLNHHECLLIFMRDMVDACKERNRPSHGIWEVLVGYWLCNLLFLFNLHQHSIFPSSSRSWFISEGFVPLIKCWLAITFSWIFWTSLSLVFLLRLDDLYLSSFL